MRLGLSCLSLALLAVAGCSNNNGLGTAAADLAPSPAAADMTMIAAAPDLSGPGSCAAIRCIAPLVCDPLDGNCKPDNKDVNVGGPCTMSGVDPACGTNAMALCNNQAADGFPGGYCSSEACAMANMLCPIGSSCAHLGGEGGACYKNCTTDSDCRMGYKCQDVQNLFVSGGSMKVCYLPDFPCNVNADCPTARPTCIGARTMPGICQ